MSGAEAQGTAGGCDHAQRWIEPLVDGELGGPESAEHAEVARHLAGCPACARRARQLAAFKAGLKAASPRPALPDGLRDRLRVALDAEPAPDAATEPATPPEPVRPVAMQARWRRVARKAAPAAAAAAVLATLMGSWHRYPRVADDAISTHRLDLPTDFSTGSIEQASAWFGTRVAFAPRFPSLPSATLVGGRMVRLWDRPAAYLVYRVAGNRISVFVFDPDGLPIDGRHIRRVGASEVYLEEKAGYHVALLRNGGLGYAFTSDLDEDRIFQLVSASIQPGLQPGIQPAVQH